MTLREFDYLGRRHRLAQEQSDIQIAKVCAVIVNMHRDPRKGRPAKVEDFLPKRKQQKQSAEQMLAALKGVAGAQAEEENLEIPEVAELALEIAQAKSEAEREAIRKRIKELH